MANNRPLPRRRSQRQKILDFLTFPLRALTIFEDDRWGLSSLRTERFDYCAAEVRGECLDVGCGRHNLFIRQFLDGAGRGIDVFPYEGLDASHLIDSSGRFPFADASFDTVTFIASLNHVPRPKRDLELAEAFRCLRPGGNILVTMGHPLAEILVHRVVALYDRLFGTRHDMDGERGMDPEEDLYLSAAEITARLQRAGFRHIRRKRFWTQWGLNGLFIGWKP
ncbi:MAG: methyltransferase domain-containing protein [Anaerolineales bacterium]